MENYRDNLELDIKDLLRHIITFWKIIIAFTVIGCILGSIFFMAFPHNTTQTDDPTNGLTKKELQQVESAVKAYVLFQKVNKLYSDKVAQELDSLDTNENINREQAETLYYEVSTLKSAAEGLTESASYSALSVDQKKVFDRMISQNIESADGIGKDTLSTDSVSQNFSMKYPLLGAFAGAFFVCFIIALRYVLSPTLKTEDDLRTAFKLPVIGTLSNGCDDGLSVVCSSIMAIIKNSKIQSLSLVSTLPGTTDSYMTKASEYLEKKGNSIEIVNSILSNPEAIDQASASDGVILFENIGKSSYENIDHEIELLNNLGIRIVGAVVAR